MNVCTFDFQHTCTVFPPIEAPGAKEMVWGASIFHREARYFEIDMVKKDSKMSPVFSASKHTHKAPIQVQVLGKKTFTGL